MFSIDQLKLLVLIQYRLTVALIKHNAVFEEIRDRLQYTIDDIELSDNLEESYDKAVKYSNLVNKALTRLRKYCSGAEKYELLFKDNRFLNRLILDMNRYNCKLDLNTSEARAVISNLFGLVFH